MISRIGILIFGAMMLAAPAYSATALDNYKRLQNEAHAFMNQLDYKSAAAKFIMASSEDVKLIWKANAMHNAGEMLKLAGEPSSEVDFLLNKALVLLIAEDPTDKTAILIKARIQRLKDKL